MDDLISKQSALDALRTCYDTETITMDNGDEYINYGDAVGEIEQLPSAQPYTIHSDGRLWITVDDIDKVTAVVVDEHKSKFCKQFYEDAQPKTGKWILDRSGAYCCSECMEPCAGYVMMKPRDKFCKMCGAKMEVTA